MLLTLEKLIKQLSPFQPVYQNNKMISIPAESITFFTRSTDYSAGESLYLGYASQFTPDIKAVQSPMLIICIEDIPLSDESLTIAGIVRLPKDTDPFLAYNAINALFQEEIHLKNFTEKLYEAVIQNYSIQKICDVAAVFFNNPLILMNGILKHIAISSDIELEDYVWLDQKKNGGYISDTSLDLLTKQMVYEKNISYTEPILLPEGDFKYRRIIEHIFINNQLAGTIVVFEIQKPFQDVDMQLVKMLSDVITLKMKSETCSIQSKNAAYEHFFNDLLNGVIYADSLYERLQTLNITILDNIFIITIDINEYDQTHRTIQYLKNSLVKTLNEGTSFIYDNYIVTIIMLESGHSISDTLIGKIEQFCQKRRLFAGISKCFHDISKLKLYFEQAVTSLDLNRRLTKTSHLAFYNQFITEHMIDIASHHTDLRLLCNEDLINLLHYDELNRTSYASSLYEFLNHERNLARTSEVLHVHRNTLIYRINRIKELLNHDLDDVQYRFSLLLSFKIISFLENAPEK
ncbi:PucR family transcriptional regulator [Lacrimispora sp. 38-1]|uniref:PucR family transcriptional regulator n=1 Tax=Lacrimispora sp. 38-1 TaxID=3125778 RepID=UPI003CF7D3D7